MARKIDPTSPAEVGARLALSRQALGYTTTTMCRMMGSVSHGSAYTNYEMGRRRISLDHALALHRTCRLSLAWIYEGELDTLPPDIRGKILALMESQQTSRKSR